MSKPLITIGRAEKVDFPELEALDIPARIDTGAKTSSLWASNIAEKDGALRFMIFGSGSRFFRSQAFETKRYEIRSIASSNGVAEQRYVVKLLVVLSGRKIRASFTLANRSSQAYPVLVGRNILRGKFVVDVTRGEPELEAERQRSRLLQKNRLRKKGF